MTRKALTTGEVAYYCHVSPQTVVKWCNRGLLNYFRLPLSQDRRIVTSSLIDLMRSHEMPIPDKLRK